MIFHISRDLQTFRHLGNPMDIERLRTAGGRVWALGPLGTLLSTDGQERLHGGLTEHLLDVESQGGTLVLLSATHLLTSQDGLAWERQPLPGPGLTRLLLTGDGALLAYGQGLWRRATLTDRWSAVALKLTEPLVGGCVLPDGAIFLVGEKGRCVVSRDGGKSFKPLKLPTTVALYAIHANSRGEVVVAGDKGTLLFSPDAGKTWARQTARWKQYPLTEAHAADHLLLATGRFQSLASRDGGKTWAPYFESGVNALGAPLPGTTELWTLVEGRPWSFPLEWPAPPRPNRPNRNDPELSLEVDPSGHWLLRVSVGHWRSQDQGVTWVPTARRKPKPVPLVGRYQWPGKKGEVMLVRRDGSEHRWSPTVTARRRDLDIEPILHSAIELPSGTWLASGEYGVVVRSQDQGKTCTTMRLYQEGGVLGHLAARGGVVLAGGWYSQLHRSIDDGVTWESIDVPGRGTAVQQILWLTDREVMVLLDRGGLALVSGDSGQSWRLVPRPTLPGGWPAHHLVNAIQLPDGSLLGWMKSAETAHDQK